jgi:hypothetical protein
VRSSGILLPVFSLDGDYGIGTLGKNAYNFVDFLSETGQKYWQILPLNPTSYGNSPYQSPCVFAGNPYLIDPFILREWGLLKDCDLNAYKYENAEKIDYSMLYNERLPLIKNVNQILGGVLGACKGFAVVIFICTILTVFFASGDNELAAAVNDSVIINLIDNVNPLVNSLKEFF